MFVEQRKKMTELDLCSNCGICTYTKNLEFCPQMNIDENLYKNPIPKILKAYITKSNFDNILKISQDGGTVSTILKYLLEKNIVDCVLTVKLGKKLTPIPVIISRSEEISEISGSKYIYTPLLTKIGELLKFSKVCVVGLPCHLRALSKFENNLNNKIEIVKIGLLCSHNFKREMYIDISREYNFNIDDIYRMEIKKNMFRIYVKNLGIIEKPLKDLEKYVSKCCKQCPELIPNYCDIAVGSMFTPEKHNITFIISNRGLEIFENIINEGMLHVSDVSSEILDKIYRVAKKKAEKALKYRQEFSILISDVLSSK